LSHCQYPKSRNHPLTTTQQLYCTARPLGPKLRLFMALLTQSATVDGYELMLKNRIT